MVKKNQFGIVKKKQCKAFNIPPSLTPPQPNLHFIQMFLFFFPLLLLFRFLNTTNKGQRYSFYIIEYNLKEDMLHSRL